jgi:hypothetical protein
MGEKPSLSSSVRLNPKVVVSPTSFGAVLLNTDTGAVWELNAVGVLIWNLLAAGNSPGEVLEKILAVHDGTRSRAESDLLDLLSDLLSQGLVEVLR